MNMNRYKDRWFVSGDEPDSRCPHCGAAVWFIRNPNGGCAYVDALGKPWPLHPCMAKFPSADSPRARRTPRRSSHTARTQSFNVFGLRVSATTGNPALLGVTGHKAIRCPACGGMATCTSTRIILPHSTPGGELVCSESGEVAMLSTLKL
jgi:hypothetical protein